MQKRNRTQLVLGILLILVAGWLIAARINPSLGNLIHLPPFVWPMWVVLAGVHSGRCRRHSVLPKCKRKLELLVVLMDSISRFCRGGDHPRRAPGRKCPPQPPARAQLDPRLRRSVYHFQRHLRCLVHFWPLYAIYIDRSSFSLWTLVHPPGILAPVISRWKGATHATTREFILGDRPHHPGDFPPRPSNGLVDRQCL